MKKLLITSALAISLVMPACSESSTASTLPPAGAPAGAPAVGKPAPAFQSVDTNGGKHSLADYRGKWVVLEWLNHDCPYVRKYYDNNAMQALQKKWSAKDVVWLSVVSSAPGKQGHFPNEKANSLTKDKGATPKAVLVDSSGTVGRAYDARTTPHMFVINPEGTLMYMGGIDDKATSRAADLKSARPHVDIALTEAMAGKPVSVPTSEPYGCNVKY